jgi:hypothetical protein
MPVDGREQEEKAANHEHGNPGSLRKLGNNNDNQGSSRSSACRRQ